MGQGLVIPRGASAEADAALPTSYVVQPGDTLSEIAEHFGTSVEALQRFNDIGDPSLVRDGVELRLR